ncbi:hypothetical protein Lpl7_0180 [Lacticaseibacillus paracasei subsp. tolerans Lpl7]|nr:hypothetical protein Lpl7_0180 [Lacticaseibacillus paracasei subsp. tolerans Lpl7]
MLNPAFAAFYNSWLRCDAIKKLADQTASCFKASGRNPENESSPSASRTGTCWNPFCFK